MAAGLYHNYETSGPPQGNEASAQRSRPVGHGDGCQEMHGDGHRQSQGPYDRTPPHDPTEIAYSVCSGTVLCVHLRKGPVGIVLPQHAMCIVLATRASCTAVVRAMCAACAVYAWHSGCGGRTMAPSRGTRTRPRAIDGCAACASRVPVMTYLLRGPHGRVAHSRVLVATAVHGRHVPRSHHLPHPCPVCALPANGIAPWRTTLLRTLSHPCPASAAINYLKNTLIVDFARALFHGVQTSVNELIVGGFSPTMALHIKSTANIQLRHENDSLPPIRGMTAGSMRSWVRA